MRYWGMPGPAVFIEEVLLATRERLNVLVAAPADAAGDLDAALLDRLRERVVDHVLVDGPDAPSVQVARALGIPSGVTRADELFAESRFGDCDVIYLQGLTAESWRGWRSFVLDYDELSKDRAVDQRPVLIGVLGGLDLPSEVDQSVTFRPFRWLGRASELDLTQYVLQRLEYAPETAGGRLLTASIVAKIALGDVELAEELARLPLCEIWEPGRVLEEWASRRGWIKGTHRHWTKGTVFRIDGRDEIHSALVALDDPSGIVRSRVWSAQAAILLPAIERERLKLIRRARNWLKPPFYLADGECFREAEDLEVGPLEYQLHRGRAPVEFRRRATDLKSLRNKLAHMETLSVDESLHLGLI